MLRIRFRKDPSIAGPSFRMYPSSKTRSTLWFESSALIASVTQRLVLVRGTSDLDAGDTARTREFQHSGVTVVADNKRWFSREGRILSLVAGPANARINLQKVACQGR